MNEPATYSAADRELLAGACLLALCAYCAEQHHANPHATALEALPYAVHAGHCHDCGAGWCECRGAFPCNYCPRRNSPVQLITPLVLFRVLVPRAPSTIPRPMTG